MNPVKEMISEAEVRKMPMNQKFRLMEILWDDFHREPDDFESPDWHGVELEATQARRQVGLEQLMDLGEAKKTLLNR